MFQPNFTISPKTSQVLMDIEASRQAVSTLPVTAQLLTSLRESARLTSTHYSTQIEGNRLTQDQVSIVAKGGTFPNRQRDETEVKNYFRALDFVDEVLGGSRAALDLETIGAIHACVMNGDPTPSIFRDGQNVIRDSASGNIVYMPPEPKDVPALMGEMVDWINARLDDRELPAPLVAAIAHYQFATIHPYYDGNGRSARLLTNLILHHTGYGLKGIYSLEKYYARNLEGYYRAISIGDSHNYYVGRAEADITPWTEYFCLGMAHSFARVRAKAEKLEPQPDQTSLLRELDARQKRILGALRENRFLTTKEIASHLDVSPRTALNLCAGWVAEGFFVQVGERRGRRYELAEPWLELLR